MTTVLDEKNNAGALGVDGESTQEKAKHPLQEHLKEIAVTALAPDIKEKYLAATQLLPELIAEVQAKRAIILDKQKLIQEKLDSVRAFKSISIDEDEFKRSDVSVKEYLGILDKMLVEIERDYAFYVSLVSDAPPKTILVFKFETDNFESHVVQRIGTIKKYAKTARRNLMVSFSRYNFGLDAQINQLSFAEQIAKSREKDSSAK